MIEKDAVLVFNGSKYRLPIVVQNAKACPVITFKTSELNDAAKEEHRVGFRPVTAVTEDMPVLLYRQNGKLTVLTGMSKIIDKIAGKMPDEIAGMELSGHLMSSVCLKKAKVDETAVAHAEPAKRPESPGVASARDPDRPYSRYAYARGQRRF